MFTIAYFFEKVNLFLHDFAGIFGVLVEISLTFSETQA